MNTSDRLIRKTYIGIWLINGTSILLGIACVLIDAVFTGQFLGASAVAAAGLVNPITLLVNIIGDAVDRLEEFKAVRYGEIPLELRSLTEDHAYPADIAPALFIRHDSGADRNEADRA